MWKLKIQTFLLVYAGPSSGVLFFICLCVDQSVDRQSLVQRKHSRFT